LHPRLHFHAPVSRRHCGFRTWWRGHALVGSWPESNAVRGRCGVASHNRVRLEQQAPFGSAPVTLCSVPFASSKPAFNPIFDFGRLASCGGSGSGESRVGDLQLALCPKVRHTVENSIFH
jgi:hypothetical protein